MARDPRPPAPAPIGRPAPRTQQPTPPAPAPAETDAARLAREAKAAHQERPEGAAAAYGGSVRMAFVFLAPDVYQRIEHAAWIDEEKVGNWMARVLDDAARARIDYEPPPAEGQGGNNPPADPDE